jgi:hypothetical protein
MQTGLILFCYQNEKEYHNFSGARFQKRRWLQIRNGIFSLALLHAAIATVFLFSFVVSYWSTSVYESLAAPIPHCRGLYSSACAPIKVALCWMGPFRIGINSPRNLPSFDRNRFELIVPSRIRQLSHLCWVLAVSPSSTGLSHCVLLYGQMC